MNRNGEYARKYRESLKEKGTYQHLLDYKREWQYRRRHGLPTTIDGSIPLIPGMRSALSKELGNKKWQDLLKEEEIWLKQRQELQSLHQPYHLPSA